jgi:hypothetical protein
MPKLNFIILLLLVLILLISVFNQEQFEKISATWTYKNIPIWTYYNKNSDVSKIKNVLFVFHGDARNASDYVSIFSDFADISDYVIICPEFSINDYPKYNEGNVISSDGTINPVNTWIFPLVQEIFNFFKQKTGNTSQTFDAWGHSAGAQFLHRFVMFTDPTNINKIICANAGFYTQVFEQSGKGSLDYPYGTNLLSSYFNLNSFCSKNITILLGENDNGIKGSTHGSPQPAPRNENNYEYKTWWGSNALLWKQNNIKNLQNWDNNAQISRNARGKIFYYGTQLSSIGTQFNWKLKEVPGVGHDPQNMARASYNILDPSINNYCTSSSPVPCPQKTDKNTKPDL